MRPPFRYFGGKTQLAGWIAAQLPPHRTYVEPFAGSAAVLFAKTPSPNEVLNDLDTNLVTLLRVIRDRPDELTARLELTPCARAEFLACRDRLTAAGPADDLERARATFVLITQSVSGTTRAGTGWSTSTRTGTNRARTVQAGLTRLRAAADRLSGVILDNRPAVKIIDLYGTPDAVIYADPPYLGAVRHRPDGTTTPTAGAYTVEMMGEPDHRALATALNSTPAAVLVSGYASDLYDDDLYAGWYRTEIGVTTRAANHTQPSRNRARAVEVIWSNRPLGTGRLF